MIRLTISATANADGVGIMFRPPSCAGGGIGVLSLGVICPRRRQNDVRVYGLTIATNQG